MQQMDQVMQLQLIVSRKLEREKERAVKWVWLESVSHMIVYYNRYKHHSNSWSHDPPVNCWTDQTKSGDLDASNDSVFLPQPSRGRGSIGSAWNSSSM